MDNKRISQASIGQPYESKESDLQVITRTANILRLLSAKRPFLRIQDVVSELSLQRTTAYRYLSSLVAEGFLQRNHDGSYSAGPLLTYLGAVSNLRHKVVDVAKVYMEKLSRKTRETIVLSLWAGAGPVVTLVEEDSSRLVHISVRLGSLLNLQAAQTQLFLAYLSDRKMVDSILSRLQPALRKTIEEGIERAYRLGFAANSNVEPGIRTLAVPIFDGEGNICATLGVVGTVQTVPDDIKTPLGRELLFTAQQISAQLGNQLYSTGVVLDVDDGENATQGGGNE